MVETGTSKILSVENVTHEQKLEKLQAAVGIGPHYYEMEFKKQKWAADYLAVVCNEVPEHQRDQKRTGLTWKTNNHFLGPWDDAETWNELITELRKVVDRPAPPDGSMKMQPSKVPAEVLLKQVGLLNKDIAEAVRSSLSRSVKMTCVKPDQPPMGTFGPQSAGIEPAFHTAGAFSGRMAGSGIPPKPSEWYEGESADMIRTLPIEVKGAVLDVLRHCPTARYSVLLRAASLTMKGRVINSHNVPIKAHERVALDLVCNLTRLWRDNYEALQRQVEQATASDETDGGDD